MGKKSYVAAVALISAASLAACGSQTVNSGTEAPKIDIADTVEEIMSYQEELETKEEETNTEPAQTALKTVTVYYGNGTAAGLRTEEVSVNEVTAESIISLLARRNIVSMDTKVESFEEKEENGKKVLSLSLNKQFKNYINLMGEDGEYIVLAGLTDTFLSCFSADELLLSVEGEPLETSHQAYTVPLVFYPLQAVEQPLSAYHLKEIITEEEGVHIVYPQFEDMKDEKVMKQWNDSIRNAAMLGYQEENLTEYKVSYEITTQNAGLVSMILRGSSSYAGSETPTIFKSTFNFDLTTGKNKRLCDYGNLEEIAEALKSGSGYHILQEGISHEELTDYLNFESSEEYVQLLENYDYNLTNGNQIPTGFSYVEDDYTLVLVIEVNHQMGDYLEVVMD